MTLSPITTPFPLLFQISYRSYFLCPAILPRVVAIETSWPTAKNSLKSYHLVCVLYLVLENKSLHTAEAKAETQNPLPSKDTEPNNQHPCKKRMLPRTGSAPK